MKRQISIKHEQILECLMQSAIRFKLKSAVNRIFSKKQVSFMSKAHSKNTPSSQLHYNPRQSQQQNANYPSKCLLQPPKFDLKKFNDYLEQRLSRKVARNQMEKSIRDKSKKWLSQQISYAQIKNNVSPQKYCAEQQFKESRTSKPKDSVSPNKPSRKHESIEKLLGKEDKSILNYNRMTQSDPEQSALLHLQRKYQYLQQKYKKLLRQASQNTKQFQIDKAQLNKMKMLHYQDQTTLSKLRTQLITLNETMNKKTEKIYTQNRNIFKCKSQEVIQSNNSTIIGHTRPSQQILKIKQLKEDKSSIDLLRVNRNRTGQNWTKSQRHKASVSQQKLKNKQSRYFSAKKLVQSSKGELKPKKNTEHIQYTNIESKLSIQFLDTESLRNSKVKLKPKPSTQTLIRFESQQFKNAPSTLQKKVVGSNGYSKYRFKPSYNFQ